MRMERRMCLAAVTVVMLVCGVVSPPAVFCAAGEKGGIAAASGKVNLRTYTDLDEALKAAKSQSKPVLVDFSGSDWCVWCQKLDKEVLSTADFRKWASKNVVFCVLDFPRNQSLVSERQREKNKAAAQKYGVQGFPTVLLLGSGGKVLLRTGYREGGAAKYVEHLENALAFVKKLRKGLEEAARLKGAARWKKLGELMDAAPSDDAASKAEIAELIWKEDKKNESGRRPEAAYILFVTRGPNKASGVMEYLDKLAGTPEDRKSGEWGAKSLFVAMIMMHRMVMRNVMAGQVPFDNPMFVSLVRDLLEHSKRVLETLSDKDSLKVTRLVRATLYACLGDKKAVEEELEQARKLGVQEKVLDYHRKLTAELLKRAASARKAPGGGPDPSAAPRPPR